jgi:hypothetical protein
VDPHSQPETSARPQLAPGAALPAGTSAAILAVLAPGERCSVLVQLDAPGTWVWHCHILDHVESADACSAWYEGGDEVGRVADLSLDYWTVGSKPDWVRIEPHQVTGRRIWHGTGTDPGGDDSDDAEAGATEPEA